MERVAVAADDIFGLSHFFLECGIVRCELIGAIGRFNEEEAVPFGGLQTAGGLLGGERRPRG